MQALRYVASVLDAGFPLVAFLQLSRVYGQALSQVADAETRLFHLYVHEPMMRDGIPGLQMAEEMEHLARDLLPLASPIMDYIHQRYLQHFVEQDVIGHMEMDLEDDAELGRVKVAVAFADLAGYTRFTEEEGEEEALSFVERFIEAVQDTIPDDARVVKTIGDEVMVVGYDVAALVDWAVGFQTLWTDRPTARIGIHYGSTLYRDGDYFGRDINLASRVVARSRGGEVLATGAVMEAIGAQDHLEFENLGEVKLKGFDEPRSLCRVYRRGMTALEAARASGLVVAGEPLLVLLSGGRRLGLPARRRDRVGGRGRGASRQPRPARGCGRRRALLPRPLRPARRPADRRARDGATRGQPPGVGARAAVRRGRADCRGRLRHGPHRCRTRPRPSSTGWRRRPGGARCWAWSRGAAGWSGRCSRSRARTRATGAASAASNGARTRRTRTFLTRARA